MIKYILEDSPLVTAILDLRFSELPSKKITDGLEDFKNKMFSLGYSIQHESQFSQINATPEINGQLQLNSIETIRWDFLNISRTSSVILTKGSLCLRTTKYTCFEQFKSDWSKVIDTFFNSFEGVQNAGMTRMGLRHVDIFLAQENEKYTNYISTKWLNQALLEASDNTLCNNKQIIVTEHGKLRVELEERLPENNSINLFPYDISDPEPLSINVDIKPKWMTATPTKYALLDIDHAWEAGSNIIELSKTNIESKLNNLHQDSSNLFWDYLSEHAENVWGKRPI
ncbi:TIGR04255 family protein [Photobacterium damselae]